MGVEKAEGVQHLSVPVHSESGLFYCRVLFHRIFVTLGVEFPAQSHEIACFRDSGVCFDGAESRKCGEMRVRNFQKRQD